MALRHSEAAAGSGLPQFTADEADERRAYILSATISQAPPRILATHWFRASELPVQLELAA